MDNSDKMSILVTILIAEIAMIFTGATIVISQGISDSARDIGWSVVVGSFVLAAATLLQALMIYYDERINSEDDLRREIKLNYRDYIAMAVVSALIVAAFPALSKDAGMIGGGIGIFLAIVGVLRFIGYHTTARRKRASWQTAARQPVAVAPVQQAPPKQP